MLLPKLMRRIGWYCFILMWIPFTTTMIGMIGLPSGEYAWAELPALTRYSLMGVGVFGGAALILLTGSPLVSWLANRSVLARGELAQAEILQIWDTGTTINNNPVVRLLLEVHPENQPSFQAETERLIPRLEIPQVQPGALVRVKYDPESLSVALVTEEESEALMEDD